MVYETRANMPCETVMPEVPPSLKVIASIRRISNAKFLHYLGQIEKPMNGFNMKRTRRNVLPVSSRQSGDVRNSTDLPKRSGVCSPV